MSSRSARPSNSNAWTRPGHTLCHICLISHTEQPALFSGDTLFNAGAGNVHNGGDVNALYSTFADQQARLRDITQVYPGHGYIENNLRFAPDRDHNNAAVRALLPRVADQDPGTSAVNTLAQGKKVNPYMRPNSPSVIAWLRESFPYLPEAPDARTIFTKFRELRNKWQKSLMVQAAVRNFLSAATAIAMVEEGNDAGQPGWRLAVG